MSDLIATPIRSSKRALRDALIAATAQAGRPDLSLPVAELMRGVDPMALAEAAHLHRVTGMVHRGLDGIDLPTDVAAAFREAREAGGLAHLISVGALSEIAAGFRERDVRWVALKGPILATQLYPDPGDRLYGDLDLLVDHRDFPAALAVLESLGYAHDIHDWARAEAVMAGQLGLTRPGMDVDLHWQLHYSTADRRPYAIDPTALIERAEPLTVSGLVVPSLDAVDRLITLSFHAARSGGHRLLWLKDIERCLSIEQPNHDEIVERSRSQRLDGAVGFMLERARRLLHAPVTDDLLGRLSTPGLRRAQRIADSISHPVRLHERDTIGRLASRSVRTTLPRALATMPRRIVASVSDRLPRPPNETDDPVEKSSYLTAVSTELPR